MRYIPNSPEEREEMLRALGLGSAEELFDSIPADIILREPLKTPAAPSETELLERFASDASLPHHATWKKFNRLVGTSGDVGIWHETYLVADGRYETIYGNMPLFGLAAAGAHRPVASRGERAAQRLNRGSQAA